MSNLINNYIEPDGRFKYCFVVIVVGNILYANPSIVFADSLRKTGSLCDLVVMIDKSINKETEDLLKFFYDKIIKIETIELNLNSDKNVILTKILAFQLTEYKKIFLVDVDTILFTNIDKILVELDTENKIYKLNKNNTGFLVFEPSDKIYKKALEFIKKNKNKLEEVKKPLNYLLDNLFDKIEFLEKKITIGINKYEDYYDGMQYIGDKPFLMTSNLTIEERMRLEVFKVWFSYFINIITKYNKIKSYECIKITIEVSKYFLASLSRFVMNFIKTNKKKKEKDNIIKNIFNIEKNKNTNYYHLDISKEYINENIYYDSNIYNYNDFLKYLNNLKGTEGKFKKYFNLTDIHKIIYNIGQDDINLQLFFLNKFVKIFSNVFISLEIKKIDDLKKSDKLQDLDSELYFDLDSELKDNLIYSFDKEINKNILENLLFYIFQTYTYSQRLILLNSLGNKNNVRISIYKTIGPISLFDTNDCCSTFLFFEMNSILRLSSVFFNQYTLIHFSKNMLLENITIKNDNLGLIERKNLIKIMYLQSFKKWIFSIYSIDEIENIFIIKHSKNIFEIIDNNLHKTEKIKKILEHKLDFINVIFIKSSLYLNLVKEKKINSEDLYMIDSYWELDGIKFLNEFVK